MRNISKKNDHPNHVIRNLATSLILFEYVETTSAKAKEVKSLVDQVIARSKVADLNAIRYLKTVFFDDNAVRKTVKELAPRYKERQSGFIRSYHLKNRLGDNAPIIRLELVDKKVFVKNAVAKEDKSTEAEVKKGAKAVK